MLHLIDLAAASEGRGYPIKFHVTGDSRESVAGGRSTGRLVDEPEAQREDDLKCLNAVVRRLLRHRRAQRMRQRNAILWNLQIGLAERYQAYRTNSEATAHDLQEQLRRLFLAHFVAPTDELLDVCVLAKDEITEDGATLEAAKKALWTGAGLSEGTMSTIRRDAQPWDEARRSFGRWLSDASRVAYVEVLQEEVRDETEDATANLPDVGKLGELAGDVLDRRFEMILHAALRDVKTFFRIFEREPLLRQLDERVEAQRLRLKRAAADIADNSDLPDEVRHAAETLRRCPDDSSERRAEAEKVLDEAIKAALAKAFERELMKLMADKREAFGPLRPPPNVGLAKT